MNKQSQDLDSQPQTLSSSPVSREEEMMKDATQDMTLADERPARQPVVANSVPGRSFKKPLLILLVALVVGGGGFVVYQKLSSKQTKTVTSTKPANSAPEEKVQQTYTPVNVVYAYKANTTDPFVVYNRPAAGGERTEALKLDRDEAILQRDVRGDKVAISTSNGLYVSKDYGKSYQQIVTTAGQEQITGVRIATGSQKLVYAVTEDLLSSTVKSIDFEGKNSKDLAKIDAGGVQIYGWNDSKNQFFYSKGCANCDGSPSSYEIYDTKSAKSSVLDIKAPGASYIQAVAISDDFSSVVAVNASADSGADAISAGAAPYFVVSFDTATKKQTIAATIGEKGETNTNGTPKHRTIVAGYVVGTSSAYYADGMYVYKLVPGAAEPTQFLITDLAIQSLDFVGDKAIFSTTQKSASETILQNYNPSTKKSTQIFEGDNNTVTIGVTTK